MPEVFISIRPSFEGETTLKQTWKKEDPAAANAALNYLGLTMEQLNADLQKPRPKMTNGDDDD